MKIPYNRVHVQGQILFAARGGAIHTFSLTDGSHISSWKHPDVDRVAQSIQAINEAKAEAAAAAATEAEAGTPATESEGPPAKRQKLEGDGENPSVSAQVETSAPATVQGGEKPQAGHVDGRGKKGKGKGKDAVDSGKSRFARVPDRPVVTHLTSTPDGKHLVAITGHDKAIWVFEHDGNGQLKQLSKRTMPKRPSAVAIGPDNQIISGDKFGDVYAIPLIIPEDGSKSAASLSSLPLPSKKAFKPTATPLTVHSKGNRLALLNQIKQAELAAQANEANSTGPDFEINLLLGHVSMLTALVLGEQQGRRYILTADRDEHIRVSRYIPHAHIIENFCFGHKEFVSEMAIPASKPDVLISGGGDEDIFVWDWVAGKQLYKSSILSLAREIAPETATVAVSGLYTLLYPSADGPLTYILAICEDIKAIFSWKLNESNELHCPGIIQLPGKPLSLATSPSTNVDDGDSTTPPTVIAAIDPDADTQAQSLHAFRLTMDNGRLAVDVETSFKDKEVEEGEPELTEEDVRGLLYTVESLRKVVTGPDDEAGSEAPHGNAESDAAADNTGDGEE